MTFKGVFKAAVAAVIITVAAAVGLWNLAVPEEALLRRLEEAGRVGPVRVEAAGFRKGLFYSVTASELRLIADGVDGPLAVATDFEARLAPSTLLTPDPGVVVRMAAGGGTVSGRVALYGARSFAASGRSVGLSALRLPLPVETSSGALDFDLSGALAGPGGRLTLEARFDAGFSGLKARAFPYALLPLARVVKARGAVRVDGNVVELKSLAFEGDGLYGRLTGTLTPVDADLAIAVDAGAWFSAEPAARFVERFKVRPGRYEYRYKGPFFPPVR